jgi:hypothetical protein
MSKPAVRVFTKDEPCSKLDLWNCFKARRGFKSPQVDEAKAIIGANAPKNMLRLGYVEVVEIKGADCYQLTEEGEEWLVAGIKGFVVRHPDRASEAVHLPRSLAA